MKKNMKKWSSPVLFLVIFGQYILKQAILEIFFLDWGSSEGEFLCSGIILANSISMYCMR